MREKMKSQNRYFNILNHYRKFGAHGNGIIIKGRVRVGKTTLVSIFAKQLLDDGFAVISNVRFHDDVFKLYPNRLFYITSDLEFFESYIKLEPDTPSVLIWDDAQGSQGMKSTQVISKSGENLSKLLIFIGKFKLIICTSHIRNISRMSFLKDLNP